MSVSDFLLLLQYCVCYSGCFPLPINFRISLLMSTKQVAGILIDIVLTLQIKLGRTEILVILNQSFLELGFIYIFSKSLISFIRILQFLSYISYTYCQIFKQVFCCCCSYSTILFLISNFSYFFLLYRKAFDFCILILCLSPFYIAITKYLMLGTLKKITLFGSQFWYLESPRKHHGTGIW